MLTSKFLELHGTNMNTSFVLTFKLLRLIVRVINHHTVCSKGDVHKPT